MWSLSIYDWTHVYGFVLSSGWVLKVCELPPSVIRAGKHSSHLATTDNDKDIYFSILCLHGVGKCLGGGNQQLSLLDNNALP